MIDGKSPYYKVELKHNLNNKKEIDWADTWLAFYEAHESLDFSNPFDRAVLRENFDSISRIWLKTLVKKAEAFAEVWVDPTTVRELYAAAPEEAYQDAMATIYYCCDRITMNRWLHIRLALNTDVE